MDEVDSKGHTGYLDASQPRIDNDSLGSQRDCRPDRQDSFAHGMYRWTDKCAESSRLKMNGGDVPKQKKEEASTLTRDQSCCR